MTRGQNLQPRRDLASATPQARDCLISVNEPQQAKKTDQHHLADERIAINQKGDQPEHYSRFT